MLSYKTTHAILQKVAEYCFLQVEVNNMYFRQKIDAFTTQRKDSELTHLCSSLSVSLHILVAIVIEK